VARPKREKRRGTVRTVREVGDPVLRTPCDPVTVFDDALRGLVDDMVASMAEADGVGLAANQIGVTKRVFVVDCEDGAGRRHVGHVVNPVLELLDESVDEDVEGCLSVPGVHYVTRRAARAAVTGVDVDGAPVRLEGDGVLGRCLQHEVDHLDGRLYLDRLDGDARRAAMRDLRERTGGP
jgi:peptide deformylase